MQSIVQKPDIFKQQIIFELIAIEILISFRQYYTISDLKISSQRFDLNVIKIQSSQLFQVPNAENQFEKSRKPKIVQKASAFDFRLSRVRSLLPPDKRVAFDC